MKKVIILVLLMFILAGNLKSAFEYQLINAKENGIGNMLIIDREGYISGFKNPSMLAEINKLTITGVFSPVLTGIEDTGIYTGGIGAGYNTGKYGAVGFIYNFFTASSGSETIYNETILKILYGIKVVNNFRAGGSLSLYKWTGKFTTFYNSSTEEQSIDFIYGINLGISFNIQKSIKAGVVVENINTPEVSKSSFNTARLPFTIKFQTLLMLEKAKRDIDILCGTTIREEEIDYQIGLEIRRIISSVNIRGGLEILDNLKGITLTAGGGYKLIFLEHDIIIDYAWNFPLINLTDTFGTHIVSISIQY